MTFKGHPQPQLTYEQLVQLGFSYDPASGDIYKRVKLMNGEVYDRYVLAERIRVGRHSIDAGRLAYILYNHRTLHPAEKIIFQDGNPRNTKYTNMLLVDRRNERKAGFNYKELSIPGMTPHDLSPAALAIRDHKHAPAVAEYIRELQKTGMEFTDLEMLRDIITAYCSSDKFAIDEDKLIIGFPDQTFLHLSFEDGKYDIVNVEVVP